MDESPVQFFLQGRRSSVLRSPVWVTLGSGTAEQIEALRRRWMIRPQGGVTELRVVEVRRTFGPVIRVPATIGDERGGADGQGRTPHPSELET